MPKQAPRTPGWRSVLPWLPAVALLILAQGAAAQLPQGAQPPYQPALQSPYQHATQPPSRAATQPPAPTLVGAPAGSGLCQCIADFDKLVFSCPGSAQACKSSCGLKYSFLPYQQCPMPPPR